MVSKRNRLGEVKAMQCPHCGYNGSKVVDSRPTDDGRVIRRRRECERCGFRFTTFERVEVTPLLVIKKNGNREEFNREKLLRGIVRSAEKRPVSMNAITDLVDHVENRLRSLGENEVTSQQIGEYVMEDLANLDEIAYIRFASVYRQFKDMSVFYKELKEIMEKDRKKNSEHGQGEK
ncbi:NrdR family transcriptional regulator [Lentilactobacillus diolivorans DSM 14421]|uniref:Transcriptional repressor NrdR n=2 Tax=Lentilactobacillus diolivorans TaxID=179838 RepID=A0A0R1SFB5_9LACO|nr:NrdR family transcriptional regulator [Lentilactobacillus diolivorans DSM 14421]